MKVKNLDVLGTSQDAENTSAKGFEDNPGRPAHFSSLVAPKARGIQHGKNRLPRRYRPHGTKYLTDSQATNIIEAVRFAKSLGLPIGELPILLGARSIAALEDDEFDDLLLEVVVLGEAQGTPKNGDWQRLFRVSGSGLNDSLV
jgi:hypothetical protein